MNHEYINLIGLSIKLIGAGIEPFYGFSRLRMPSIAINTFFISQSQSVIPWEIIIMIRGSLSGRPLPDLALIVLKPR